MADTINYGRIITIIRNKLIELTKEATSENQQIEVIKKAIVQYLKYLESSKKLVYQLIDKSTFNAYFYKRRKNLMLTAGNEININSIIENFNDQRKIIQQNENAERIERILESVYKYGYSLIMLIRENIIGTKIDYSIASTSRSVEFSIDEPEFLNLIRISLSSLRLSIENGETNLNFMGKLKGTYQKEKEMAKLNALNILKDADGTTFWSRGLRVLSALQALLYETGEYKSQKDANSGINKGHFYEAYYYYNGNKINNESSPQGGISNLQIAGTMLALRNNKPFYKGGDYKDTQLKVEGASITSFNNIETTLRQLLQTIQQFSGEQGANLAVAEMKKIFSSKEDGVKNLVEETITEKMEEIKAMLEKSINKQVINLFK